MNATFEAAIERELGDLHRRDLRGPASVLSERYRFGDVTGDTHGFASGQAQAYLATRAPATFAATRKVLAELGLAEAGLGTQEHSRLGGGPGNCHVGGYVGVRVDRAR